MRRLRIYAVRHRANKVAPAVPLMQTTAIHVKRLEILRRSSRDLELIAAIDAAIAALQCNVTPPKPVTLRPGDCEECAKRRKLAAGRVRRHRASRKG